MPVVLDSLPAAWRGGSSQGQRRHTGVMWRLARFIIGLRWRREVTIGPEGSKLEAAVLAHGVHDLLGLEANGLQHGPDHMGFPRG